MAEENKDQKTEEASAKRIQEAEEKGNFTHSREMTSSFILMAAILAFFAIGQQGPIKMMDTWRAILTQSHALTLSTEELYQVFLVVLKSTFFILAPILFTIMFAGIVSNLIQTRGFKVSFHPLLPKFNKLNPLKGFGRIFSKNSAMELFKSLFKITLVSIIAYQTVKGHWDQIPPLMGFGVGQSMVFMGEVALEIMFKVMLAMILLAAFDYAFQRFTYLENLRMTKQEVKDERKETEGNPQIKQRIRAVQTEMMRPAHDVRRARSRRGGDQPHPHRRGHQIRSGKLRSSHRRGEGGRGHCPENPSHRRGQRRAHRRGQTAGAGAAQDRGGGAVDSRQPLQGGGGDFGVRLPFERKTSPLMRIQVESMHFKPSGI